MKRQWYVTNVKNLETSNLFHYMVVLSAIFICSAHALF